VEENPKFNNEEIVEAIRDRWQREDIACFTPRWLRELVRRWRRNNVIPPQTHSPRRRTYPSRRFRRF
jgi:hypothetical protein